MNPDQHTHAGLCRGCGQPVHRHDRFCEGCGRPDPAAPHRSTAPTRNDTATRVDIPVLRTGCADCADGVIGADGYCEQCGLRQRPGRDHAETDLGPSGAAVSDRGLRRRRNEDAVALAALPGGMCAVVCDGVATAPGSAAASRLAADTAAAVLAGRVSSGQDQQAATHAAAERAAAAVTGLADGTGPDTAPACTFVSAVVDRTGITVGWIGDSRAYWLTSDTAPGAASRALTSDDSWAARMVESGEMTADAAWADRRAHALTAWLGADAGAVETRVAAFRPTTSGLVLLCSDGLWNHLPDAADLASVALPATATAPGDGPLGAARRLLRAALDAGGHDNVTVAVIPFPPPEPSREPGR